MYHNRSKYRRDIYSKYINIHTRYIYLISIQYRIHQYIYIYSRRMKLCFHLKVMRI